jgi:two-component system NarL family sensor kinase
MRSFYLTLFRFSTSIILWAVLIPSTVYAQRNTDAFLEKIALAKSDTAKAKLYNQFSYQYAEVDTLKAYELQKKALSIFIKYNNYRGIANNHLAKANILLTSSQYDKAFACYHAGKEIALKYRFYPELSSMATGMGFVERKKHNLPKALIYFNEAIVYSEKAKDKRAMAFANRQIATIYTLSKNFKKSKEYLLYSYQLFSEIKEINGMAELLGSIGFTERNAGHLDSAIHYFNRAVAIFDRLKNSTMMAVAFTEIGKAYQDSKQYQLAIDNFLKGLDAYRQTQNASHLDALNIFIGDAYMAINQLEKAKPHLDKGYKLAINEPDVEMQLEALWSLYDFENRSGNKSGALLYLEKHGILKDSLDNKRQLDLVATLNEKYQSEKKQQQIVLLNNANRIQSLELNKNRLEIENKNLENDRNVFKIGSQELLIQRNKMELNRKQVEAREKMQKIKLLASQNEVQKLEIDRRNILLATILGVLIITILLSYLIYNRYKLKQETRLHAEVIAQQDLATKAVLNAEENERKRISGELHDGLGQMFSAVKMNLSALTEDLNFKNDDSKKMFEKTMGLVDESCKEVRVISHQMAPNVLLKSGLAAAVRDFINKIDARKLKINLETMGLQDRIDQNIETVLYRVIQETVNNVIKHSGANALDIQLDRDDEGINAMIEDNGKGFDATQLEKFEGIGLKNIRTRINFLKGTVDFSSSPNQGTLIAIFIPFY